MSETVLVAIVGIIAAAFGGVLGATVSGYFAFKIARENSQAQLKAVREELQQANEQEHRTRLVEARKAYLLEIRTLMGGVFGATMTIPTLLIALKGILESGGPLDSEPSKRLFGQMKEASMTMMELPQVFSSMGQMSDQILLSRLVSLFESFGELNPGMQKRIDSRNGQSTAQDPSSEPAHRRIAIWGLT